MTGYDAFFDITTKNINFSFTTAIDYDDDFSEITISPVAYELENLIGEIKGIIFKGDFFTEEKCPFRVEPIFHL